MGAKHGVSLEYSRPGKPIDNGFVESFNGRLWDECLNQNIFVTVAETRRILEEWWEDSATVSTKLWGGKAPWRTVQPSNPQTRQEPLTYHWYREWVKGNGHVVYHLLASNKDH